MTGPGLASGYRCPTCEGATQVLETRMTPGGLRRRRQCVHDQCATKFTTMELAVATNGARASATSGPMVAVSTKDLKAIASLVEDVLGSSAEAP